MLDTLRLAWSRFGIIGAVIGDLQGKVISILFYFTILMPFGIGSRLLSDPLRIRKVTNPQWLQRDPIPTDLDSAQKQG